ncbi:hypothetical protein H6P81_010186 [Aristolochia fimbriata]|uniref:Secreted protein n=1 Tax=Aristolochia fimbriata TaxID=158543 RepID=A0AAV7EQX6_ARIFI|nr:hypothetical protein H6P81_010186 [Aristolochia fimbriata]
MPGLQGISRCLSFLTGLLCRFREALFLQKLCNLSRRRVPTLAQKIVKKTPCDNQEREGLQTLLFPPHGEKPPPSANPGKRPFQHAHPFAMD